MKPAWGWFIVGGVAVMVATVAALEHRNVARWRDELELRRARARELAALVDENRRLRANESSAEELERWAKLPEERRRWRNEVARLAAKLREPEPPATETGLVVAERELPAAEWKNAGRGTPEATLETALWAAAGGEVDVLAQLLAMDEPARRRAGQLLDGLPEPSRSTYRTPERLLALLAAKDLPAGVVVARVSAVSQQSPGEVTMRVRLQEDGGASRSAKLTVRRVGAEWGLVVSERAVAKYGDQLTAPSGR